MKRKFIYILMVFLMSVNIFAADMDMPKVNARSAILMDYESGRVLWAKDADLPLAMASTTKIMTAILTLEKGNLKDIVTVSKNAAAAPPVKMHLKAGERQRLEDLLYALMLQSSNDAAVAIAEHIGGSVENFCQMMTDKAREWGATDTVFRTPNGLDWDDHHSTAKDLALITRYALSNPEFIRIINTKEVQTPTSGGDFRQYHIYNKNRLLNEYEGAIGVKTGFTGKAGHCFVGAAKQDNLELISVVLASGWGNSGKEQKWIDTKRILNYGFDNYMNETIAIKDTSVKNIEVLHSREKQVDLVISSDVTVPLSKAEKEKIQTKIQAPASIEAPIAKGTSLGKINFYLGDELLSQITLETKNGVARHDFNTSLRKIITSWFNQ